MRICLVTSSFLPQVGGAEIVVHQLALALVELGHAVTVLAPRYSARLRRVLPYRLETFLPGTLTLLNRNDRLGEAFLLGTLARMRGRFDVLNLHFALPLGPAFVRHRWVVGAPLLLTFHGTDIQTDPAIGYGLRLDPQLDRKIRLTANDADGLVAISPSVRAAIGEMLAPPRPVFDIPNGVDVRRLSQERPRGRFRARLGIPPEAPLLLAVGRNHPKKGFDLLLEAARLVAQDEPRVHCAVVGRGVTQLRPLAERLGLRGQVHLVEELSPRFDGRQVPLFPPEEVVDAYRDCDVYVSPSRMEGSSLAVLEALAAGCAVVVTDAPGNRDAVRDGENGLLCPPEDPKALSQRILRLLRDPRLRTRLGEAARASALALDWQKVAARYADAYAVVARVTDRVEVAT
ncbi:MAG: glycosyltransferase family 4 protein [Armatimonadetes bacterium]|nr:glycosyltransferase family 4 protein [Armatimonadota bacterium]MDW8153883.1 glycosyltransferase family 4 protein [Armatimonadota bacterium]